MSVISIIVPVYRVEKYLSRCIDSILSQTFKDFELILVNDGSPDNSRDICNKYAEKDKRVIVLNQANGGVSVARNAGLNWVYDNSDSQWITFVDSDDWIHPNYLEFLYNGAVNRRGKISICEFVRTNEQKEYPLIKKPLIDFIKTEDYYFENNTNFILAWGKLYHRDCFKSIRYPVGRIHEDEFVTYKILFEFEKLVLIREHLYYYFSNPEGITHTKFTNKRYDVLQALYEREKYFHERGMTNLENHAKNSALIRKSLYAILARKDKVYSKVPEEYKIGIIKAFTTLYEILGRDRYEAMLVEYCPHLIKLQAYYFKIKGLLKAHPQKTRS